MSPPLAFPDSSGEFLSPSLAPKSASAYELKFLLSEEQACRLEAHIQGRLTLDVHADPALDRAYRTTSVYCDTASLDVFHRTPSFRRRKFRARRYGDEPCIYLERKSRWGDRVAKRRTSIPMTELSSLSNPSTSTEWVGHWFQTRVQVRGLRPVCQIVYERIAYVGQGMEGPIRLTFDRKVHGRLADRWDLTDRSDGKILTNQVICEWKYQTALPTLFKELLHELRLSPGSASKYRLCMQAWGTGR